MIIHTEDTPKTRLDAQQLPHYLASPDTPLQTESPPAYYGSHGPYVPQGSGFSPPYVIDELPLPASKREQSPTSRRFLRTLFVAVFIWVFLGVFLRTVIPWGAGWGNDTVRHFVCWVERRNNR